jgi:endonuclease/exonuclease/phosphatase family metal-dependent hydrolase
MDSKKNSKSIVSFLFYLFCFFSLFCQTLNAAENQKEQIKASAIKVMTFNIRNGYAKDGPDGWEHRRKMVINVIQDANVDVVGLQEAVKMQIDQLRDSLDEFGILATYRDGKSKGQSNALLYRKSRFSVDCCGTFWLSDSPDKPDSTSWENKESRFCTWMRLIEKKNGKGFYFFNVHLDHLSQYSREKSVILIIETIEHREHNEPIVLLGDLNIGEDNSIIKFLKGKEMTIEDKTYKSPIVFADTFRIKHGCQTDAGSFNGFGKREKFEKIDYIFVQKSVQVLDTEVIKYNQNGRYPSDHCPVTACLMFP